MRHLLAYLILSLLALSDPQRTSSNARIAQVPNGTVAQSIYSNDALEVSFQIRNGWTATLIPAGLCSLHQDAPPPIQLTGAQERCFQAS